ncbi:hypothetical protein [Streptomyces sp. NPDC051219]|uniref:hypothetical protein n=1 Tax=Streptomyces sp. NPDC051219 TaxID=3155283 RepID=UPI0034267F65
MGPETRTGRRARLAGGVVAPLAFGLALAVAGVSNPALAATSDEARPADPVTCVLPDGGAGPESGGLPADDCQDSAGPRGPRPPAPGPVPLPCNDLDAVALPRGEEYGAVLVNGRAYAGRRIINVRPPGRFFWQNLTTSRNPGYPRNACGISISAIGLHAWIRVVTTDGRVYETHCDTPRPTLYCDERWVQLVRPV